LPLPSNTHFLVPSFLSSFFQPMCCDILGAVHWTVGGMVLIAFTILFCGVPAALLGRKRFRRDLWGPEALPFGDGGVEYSPVMPMDGTNSNAGTGKQTKDDVAFGNINDGGFDARHRNGVDDEDSETRSRDGGDGDGDDTPLLPLGSVSRAAHQSGQKSSRYGAYDEYGDGFGK
jgi:hypothetical protein